MDEKSSLSITLKITTNLFKSLLLEFLFKNFDGILVKLFSKLFSRLEIARATAIDFPSI